MHCLTFDYLATVCMMLPVVGRDSTGQPGGYIAIILKRGLWLISKGAFGCFIVIRCDCHIREDWLSCKRELCLSPRGCVCNFKGLNVTIKESVVVTVSGSCG